MTDEQLKRLLALDSAPGPALAIDTAHADVIVEAALTGAGFGPGGGGRGGSSGGSSRGSGRASGSGSAGSGASASGGTMAIGTKLAIVAVAALVVVAIALFAWRSRRGGSEQLAAPTVDAAVDSAVTGTGAPSQAAPSDDLATTVRSPDDASPDDPPLDDRSREAERPRDEASADPPRRVKPSRAPSPADEAADLLGEANAKRAAKQWRESDVLYARVVRIAPKSLAAQTALVASASLRLEHLGDPKGAAQRFRRALALAPSGALAEDARWGLVEAARASRDPAGEAAALDEFLAHHPRSPLASRAKARRAELR